MSQEITGRPSLYRKEFCEMLIEHMKQGYSYKSFCAEIEVGQRTMYDWELVHPEWAEAKEIAFAKGMKFWEKLGVDFVVNETSKDSEGNSTSKTLNSAVWIFNMKNRFQWRERQPDEVTQIHNNQVSATVSAEDLPALIAIARKGK